MTPDRRLERLRAHAVRGFARARTDDTVRRRAVAWLDAHPSGVAAVDASWREALAGRGELYEWLAGGATPLAWTGALPLHTVLAGHPFAEMGTWFTETTSTAS